MGDFATEHLLGLLAALGAGLLIGIDRERKVGRGPNRAAAGVRTFSVIALCGAVCALIGMPAIVMGGAAVALFAYASYQRTRLRDPGLTSELAMLLTFLLGALAIGHAQLAAALAVIVAILLASKEALHEFTRRTLTGQELRDGLILAASALIVLPLLPDHAIDPLGVINPRRLWLIVVLVMAINASGYVAARAVGARYGLPLAGFIGGFVSSTATHNSLGQRARETPSMRAACVSGALLSNIATVLQLAFILGALAPALLRAFVPSLIAAAVVAAAFGLYYAWRAKSRSDDDPLTRGRPFRLRQALLFAAIVAAALLVSALAHRMLGAGGTVVATALAGFADVHAAAVSVSQLIRDANLQVGEALPALLAAFSTNALMKCIAGFAGGGFAYARALIAAQVAINAAAWAGWWYFARDAAAAAAPS